MVRIQQNSETFSFATKNCDPLPFASCSTYQMQSDPIFWNHWLLPGLKKIFPLDFILDRSWSAIWCAQPEKCFFLEKQILYFGFKCFSASIVFFSLTDCTDDDGSRPLGSIVIWNGDFHDYHDDDDNDDDDSRFNWHLNCGSCRSFEMFNAFFISTPVSSRSNSQ